VKLKNRPSRHSTVLPGGQILDRIMRLLVASVGAGLIYGLVTRGRIQFCSTAADPGGSGGDGPATRALGCGTLTLTPSSWVYLLMALTAIVLLSRAIRNSPNEATAVHLIRWAGMIVPLIGLAAAAIALLAFYAVPIESLLSDPPPPVTVPFGSVELEITD